MSEKIRGVVLAELNASGMSRREVARRSGVSADIISNYLAGKKEIQTDTLDRILAVFGKELKAVRRQVGGE